MRTLRRIAPHAFLGAASLAVLLPLHGVVEGFGDEGLLAVAAEKTLNGQIPYRDFFEVYPPGNFWLLAAFFAVFGTSFATIRLLWVAVGVSLVLVTYVIARRLIPPRFALLPPLMAPIWSYPFSIQLSHHWLSTLVALLALLPLLADRDTSLHYALAGLLTGMTALFLHHKAALITLAVTGITILVPRRPGAPSAAAALLAYVAGLAIPLVPTIAYFHWNGALDDLWYGTVRFVRERYAPLTPHFLHLPNTFLINFVWTLPPDPLGTPGRLLKFTAALLGTVAVIHLPIFALAPLFATSLRALQHDPGGLVGRRLILVAAFAASLLLATFPLLQLFHYLFITPLLFIAVAILLHSTAATGRRFPHALLLLLLLLGFITRGKDLVAKIAAPKIPIATPRGTIWIASNAPDGQTAAPLFDFVRRAVPPGETIFFYPDARYPLVYFLTRTTPLVRPAYLRPPYHTSDQFLDTIDRFNRDPPRIILVQRGYRPIPETEWIWQRFPDSYAKDAEFRRFLAGRYREAGDVGVLRLYLRRE